MHDLMTISDLQRHFGVGKHVVDHAIERHGPAPVGRVGITRVWSRDQLPAIKESLAKNAAARSSAV